MRKYLDDWWLLIWAAIITVYVILDVVPKKREPERKQAIVIYCAKKVSFPSMKDGRWLTGHAPAMPFLARDFWVNKTGILWRELNGSGYDECENNYYSVGICTVENNKTTKEENAWTEVTTP